MAKSNQWLQVKRILGQASVVLEELSMVLSKNDANQADQTTQGHVNRAKQSISDSTKDEETIQRASELIEYDSLIRKLKAKDLKFTSEELKRAREL